MEKDNTLTIRALDPDVDIDLFRDAYSWRTKRKNHIQPDRMGFEEFSANDPKHIVMGLFNGELCAVFMFKEFEQGWFETHFTTRKDAPKDCVLRAAETLADWFNVNQAGLTANIVERNTPLRRFVEAIGFSEVGKFDHEGTAYIRYARNLNSSLMVA